MKLTTKEKVIAYMNIMETIESLIAKCERLGWDEINEHKEENMTAQEAGWAMQGIAGHMNWWIYNSSDYAEEWEILEKIRKCK